MYKVLAFSVVVVGLVVTPLLSGGPESGPDRERAPGPPQAEQAVVAEQEPEPVDRVSCEWTCQACAPDQGCSQICTELGDCGSVCGVTARCEPGHRWDESSCACVGATAPGG